MNLMIINSFSTIFKSIIGLQTFKYSLKRSYLEITQYFWAPNKFATVRLKIRFSFEARKISPEQGFRGLT